MTVQEAAKILEVKPSVVYDLCARRLLGHHRIGIGRGVIRITPADLDAYLASCAVPPREPRPSERPAGNGTGLAVRSILGEMRAEREVKRSAPGVRRRGDGRSSA